MKLLFLLGLFSMAAAMSCGTPQSDFDSYCRPIVGPKLGVMQCLGSQTSAGGTDYFEQPIDPNDLPEIEPSNLDLISLREDFPTLSDQILWRSEAKVCHDFEYECVGLGRMSTRCCKLQLDVI